MKFIQQALSLFLSCCPVLVTAPAGFAQTDQSTRITDDSGYSSARTTGSRRIGENETTALAVCEEFALTAKEGNAESAAEAKAASQDPITRFAQSLVSAVTAHADRSTRVADSENSYLFHGYFFRSLTTISADGDNNKGLALVAYPAEYRSSGVKTLLVTKKGLVFEKDLGPSTATVAPTIGLRTSDWRPAE